MTGVGMQNAAEVVWLHTGFIGDLILLSAAIEALAVLQPHTTQILATNGAGAAVFADDTRLNRIQVIDKRAENIFKLRHALAHLGHAPNDERVFIQVHKSVRSSLLLLGQRGKRVTYQETPLGGIGAARVPRVAVLHEYQRLLLLLEAFGFSRERLFSFKPKLHAVSATAQTELLALSQGKTPLIGVAPGIVCGTKRWPSEHYAALVARMLRTTSATVVLLGSKAEQEACAVIKQNPEVMAFGGGRIVDLSGQTSIKELRFIIPKLRLLLANDSAPLHFASAFDIPTMAFFGATVPALGFGPVATESIIFENMELSCRPCSDHGPKVCPLGHFKCMRDLTPERIWPQVSAFLEKLGLSAK
jgi:heptosyltransferase-2